MSQHVVYVRHAESTNNDLYARTGSRDGRDPDPLLTSLGERQVGLAGDALAREGLGDVPVWASPTARAVQTAAAVMRAGTGSRVVLVPDLVEGGGTYRCDGGVRVATPGRPLPELRAFAGVPLDWADPVNEGWSGGFEEHDVIPARAACLVDAVRASGHPTIVLVAHEWLAQHVIRAALGLPPGNDATRRGWFSVPDASITEIALDDDGSAELVRLGVTTHLGEDVRLGSPAWVAAAHRARTGHSEELQRVITSSLCPANWPGPQLVNVAQRSLNPVWVHPCGGISMSQGGTLHGGRQNSPPDHHVDPRRRTCDSSDLPGRSWPSP